MENNISVAIPFFNNTRFLNQLLDSISIDKKVSEIVISDDHSSEDEYSKLCELVDKREDTRIRLFRNNENKGCFGNKVMSVSHCSNDWVARIDSDDYLYPCYWDAIFNLESLDIKTVYSPSFGREAIDLRHFDSIVVSKENVQKALSLPRSNFYFNNGNSFFHRETYLDVINPLIGINPMSADELFFSYNWLKAGGKRLTVKGMEYFHREHPDSFWWSQHRENPEKLASITKELKNKLFNLGTVL
jgi:glycosyltransferase involved in cell wall biosynthesis